MSDLPTRILVTGANGQLGQEVMALAANFPAWELIPSDRHVMDISRREDVLRFFDRHRVDFCINCAAYTAVDQAESQPDIARQINALGPGYLAEACRQAGAGLLHFSSDYVYHTHHNRPYREDAPTNPQGVYARTKLEGDERVQQALPEAVVLRTSWVYSSYGNNFVKTMLRLATLRDTLRVVYDQVGAPTYARDLAGAALAIIRYLAATGTERPPKGGIYHYSNEGVTSWYDLALAIFELSHIDCHVLPIESKDFPTPAARPFFSVLNKDKIKETFALTIPHWRTSLRECLKRITADESP